MPRIAEIKTINNELWVKLDKPPWPHAVIYIWTEDELKAHDKSVIAAYIEELANANPPPIPTNPREVPGSGDQ